MIASGNPDVSNIAARPPPTNANLNRPRQGDKPFSTPNLSSSLSKPAMPNIMDEIPKTVIRDTAQYLKIVINTK